MTYVKTFIGFKNISNTLMIIADKIIRIVVIVVVVVVVVVAAAAAAVV